MSRPLILSLEGALGAFSVALYCGSQMIIRVAAGNDALERGLLLIDGVLEEAALGLGASKNQLFWRILLPALFYPSPVPFAAVVRSPSGRPVPQGKSRISKGKLPPREAEFPALLTP